MGLGNPVTFDVNDEGGGGAGEGAIPQERSVAQGGRLRPMTAIMVGFGLLVVGYLGLSRLLD